MVGLVRRGWGRGLAFAALLAFSPGTAGAISLTLDDLSTGGEYVYFDFEQPDGSHKYWANAAELSITLGEGDAALQTIAYCVELDETIYFGEEYDVRLAEPWIKNAGWEAAWLMDHFAPGLGNAVEGYEESEAAAALQLAIWDLVHGDALTVSDANAPAILELHDFYMDRLARVRPSTDLRYDYDIAWVADVQDLLVHRRTARPTPKPTPAPAPPPEPGPIVDAHATPEPGTWAMLAFGMLAWISFRKRAGFRFFGRRGTDA